MHTILEYRGGKLGSNNNNNVEQDGEINQLTSLINIYDDSTKDYEGNEESAKCHIANDYSSLPVLNSNFSKFHLPLHNGHASLVSTTTENVFAMTNNNLRNVNGPRPPLRRDPLCKEIDHVRTLHKVSFTTKTSPSAYTCSSSTPSKLKTSSSATDSASCKANDCLKMSLQKQFLNMEHRTGIVGERKLLPLNGFNQYGKSTYLKTNIEKTADKSYSSLQPTSTTSSSSSSSSVSRYFSAKFICQNSKIGKLDMGSLFYKENNLKSAESVQNLNKIDIATSNNNNNIICNNDSSPKTIDKYWSNNSSDKMATATKCEAQHQHLHSAVLVKNPGDGSVNECSVNCTNSEVSDYEFFLRENEKDIGSSWPNDADTTFAGYRNYMLPEKVICGETGTVRGMRNRVRAGIATFRQQALAGKNFHQLESNKVVVYTTATGIVRETFQQCLKVKTILSTLLVSFEERDIFRCRAYQRELADRLGDENVLVPQVFVEGHYLGDANTIERLNECGRLRKILRPYKRTGANQPCHKCGGYLLLLCSACNGSKKSVTRNQFSDSLSPLRCVKCDECGLVPCDLCCTTSSLQQAFVNNYKI